MITWLSQGSAALLLGLLGSGHCLAMCGGIAISLHRGVQGASSYLVYHQLGRIASYVLIAALATAVIQVPASNFPLTSPLLRLLAGVLLICMGLYLANIWRGFHRLERLGLMFWQHLRPVITFAGSISSPGLRALALGAIWGYLPCSLVYGVLAWVLATAAGDVPQSSWLMLCFGLGTAPSMFVTGWLGGRLMQSLQRYGAFFLLLLGAWTLWGGVQVLIRF